ncbi:MAG: class I SAM-dependent rRNA methyltransferase [Pseudomonadota bacterium]
MTEHSYPIVKLRPKVDARPIRFGAPWVYANDLVLDRRTKALAPGTLAELRDGAQASLGLVAINPLSQIAVRMIDRDLSARIDQAWFEARIEAALAHRSRLYAGPHYRLIHAEADGLPGLIVDRFDDVLVVQPNAAWIERLLEPLVAALQHVTGATCVMKNAKGRTRGLEGLDDFSDVLIGTAPDAPMAVPMNGATYFADLTQGQKTGLFYDQRPNHAFAAALAQDCDVLDVFSHVGGFGLAALAGGARAVTCVDGSQDALTLATRGAETMDAEGRFSTRRGDAFDVLQVLSEEGAQFDVVICDPPAFAPNKPSLEKGLRAYERVARLAAGLVREGGYLGLCSCSHAADLTRFSRASNRGIGRAGRRAQLVHTGEAGPDHPKLPQLSESGYLKALFYRILS